MMTRVWAVAVGLVGALSGCGEKATSGAAPSASTSAVTAATTATARPIDLREFCAKTCKRAAACGAESAAALAKAGGAKDKGALEKANLDQVESSCVAACKAETPAADAGPTIAKATKCLDDTTCEGFTACLEAASGGKSGAAK